MNRRGEVSASEHEERTRNLGIYCQSRKELGKGYRVMDLTLCSPNIWKTQETTVGWGGRLKRKKGLGTTQATASPTYELADTLSPDYPPCGHSAN